MKAKDLASILLAYPEHEIMVASDDEGNEWHHVDSSMIGQGIVMLWPDSMRSSEFVDDNGQLLYKKPTNYEDLPA